MWDALYKMLEDPDVRVRQDAWHTLQDGGTPNDPALDPIIERQQKNETDKTVKNMMRQVLGPHLDRAMHVIKALGQNPPKTRGKCDFCGASDVFVERDLGTDIPAGDHYQPAWTCADCGKAATAAA